MKEKHPEPKHWRNWPRVEPRKMDWTKIAGNIDDEMEETKKIRERNRIQRYLRKRLNVSNRN